MPAHRHKKGMIKMNTKDNRLIVTMDLIGEKHHDRKQLQWNELQDKLADAVTDKKNVGAILSDIFFCVYDVRLSGKDIYVYNKGKYKKLTEEVTAKKLNDLICDYEKIRGSIKSIHYKECYRQIKIRCDKEVKKLPKSNNKPYILCKNGVVDIQDLSLKEKSKKYGFTSGIKAKFKAEATGEKFEKFIDFATGGDDELKRLLQEVMGYAISEYTNLRKAFIFQGPKGTGKSLFLDIIRTLVGIDNTSSVDLQNLDREYYRANILSSKVNIAPDTPEKAIKEIGTFKSLTSELDVISGRNPYEGVTQYRCKSKLLFGTNHYLRFTKVSKDDIIAVFDRLVYIPFVNQVKDKERNVNLRKELLKEKNYIFTWACKGLKRLYDNDFEFSDCAQSKKMYNDALAQYCPEKVFAEECIMFDCKDEYETSVDVGSAFMKFLRERGISEYNENDIRKYLEELGVEKVRKRIDSEYPQRIFLGIRLI